MNIQERDIADITPYSKNAKKHPKEQVKKIAASIQRFGFRQPVVVDKKGVIVIGHGRVEAAKELGMTTVPVTVADDLTDKEISALRLADNKLNESEWDMELVNMELGELDAELKELTGFEAMEVLEAVEDDFDTTPPEEPKSKLGDLYQLGEHRLLCGDATKIEDVERLMDGENADICFTSPPYGAGNVAKLRQHGGKGEESFYKGHTDRPEEWLSLMGAWYTAVRPSVDSIFCNVQMLADNKKSLVEWVYANRDELVDVIIWDKVNGAPQMADNVLTNCYEFIYVFGGNGSRSIPFANFHGTENNIVRINPKGKNEFADTHKAVFPIAIPSWIMGVCSNAKSVIDPFMGTGTTLIACEQLGRKCYGIEKEPAYCDVIINRWEKLTGQKTQLIT